jgi:rhamnose utilization protein RhaD (predicted bifunctional aldolase and dehydrogenase)
MSITELIDISRSYGSNPEYVIAGGGNTSYKEGAVLYVKSSGAPLSDITAGGFVRMNRQALSRIWGKAYSPDPDRRESEVLADMMAAREAGEETKRPSVETLLHDILPFVYVVHTHPSLVNGLTCSQEGEKAAEELFGGEVLWIPSTNPGYILARKVKNALEGYTAKHGKAPGIILLQNHGVFAGADDIPGIKAV